MINQLVQISTHSFKYRNFLIVMLPAKTLNPVTRFHVQRNGDSFGLFDSMDEATGYIDKLCIRRNTSPIIDEVPFHQ
ncbi:hypothetical protein J6836_09625 [Providencia sp. R33]|uniref:hypothetical protein n=1 Tax=Providencia TaxID=586 RepID=UPI001C5B7D09|nr:MULTISPECIES: hypothetical protein [Providencia]QXX84597.1 hypothetical protein J6836_09625 [Providencia sp. R33]